MLQTTKTAISLKTSLFDETNKLAKNLHISRSQLFTLALEDFLKRLKNQQLLEQFNKAYEGGLDHEEKKTLAAFKEKRARSIEEEW